MIRRLSAVSDGWSGAFVVFVTALVAYWIEALAWPLQRGRDSWDYWLYWLQLLDRRPPFSQVMLFRTPLAPLVTGLPMSIGGAQLLEVVMSVLFAASVLGWAWAARPFGRRAAIVVTVAVLSFQLPYAALFHEVSSDFLFGALLALWAGLVVRAGLTPSPRLLVGVGLGAAALTLARPAGQVVVLAAAGASLVAAGPARARLGRLTIVLAAALVPLILWAGVNAARYDDFTVARGGKAWVPFFKVFGEGKIDPANGPASRRLAAAIERDVLTRPPFRRHHDDVGAYLRDPSNFEAIRLIALSDRDFGRSSNYDVLYDAALEAVRRHPGWYARSVASTFWHFVAQGFALDQVRRGRSYPRLPPTMQVDGKTLPSPSALSPLVVAARYGFVWCPTDDIDPCIFRRPARAFSEVRDQRRYSQLASRVRSWNAQLPLRDGNRTLATKLDTLSFDSPRSIVWLILGAAALALRRPRGGLALVVLLVAAALVLLVHAVSQSPQAEFELPLAPLFLLVAVASLSGPRARGKGGLRSDRPA